jgi:hypothetical protein
MSAQQYDNTNTASLFPSAPQGTIVGSGKIFFGAQQKRTILVDDVTPNGKQITRIFVEVGAIFPNNNKNNEKSPDFSGSLELPRTDCDSISLWTRQSKSTGAQFWSGSISKRPPKAGATGGGFGSGMREQTQHAAQQDLDDDIPF